MVEVRCEACGDEPGGTCLVCGATGIHAYAAAQRRDAYATIARRYGIPRAAAKALLYAHAYDAAVETLDGMLARYERAMRAAGLVPIEEQPT